MFKYITIVFIFLFLSCKKDKSNTCPSEKSFYLFDFAKQFNFKSNNYWVFKNTTTNIKDTLRLYDNPGIKINKIAGSSKECYYQGGIEEIYRASFYHKFILNTSSTIQYSANSIGLYGGYYAKYNVSPLAVVFNIGDSSTYNNKNYWCKLENKFTNISINGNIYNNVYQMYYYPDYYGFSRIWWCPTIGFIKLEYYNTSSNVYETLELDSYDIQLY